MLILLPKKDYSLQNHTSRIHHTECLAKTVQQLVHLRSLHYAHKQKSHARATYLTCQIKSSVRNHLFTEENREREGGEWIASALSDDLFGKEENENGKSELKLST